MVDCDCIMIYMQCIDSGNKVVVRGVQGCEKCRLWKYRFSPQLIVERRLVAARDALAMSILSTEDQGEAERKTHLVEHGAALVCRTELHDLVAQSDVPTLLTFLLRLSDS
jgi:hypothetical protein